MEQLEGGGGKGIKSLETLGDPDYQKNLEKH